ncbi:MAG: hypothetical protein U9Q76_09980, partial [candidate division WOR-3 bacterium]|nr:hypothetical protein [candidate division WOR-3 bacterium]
LTPLGKLAFASSDYPWDAQAAAKRVQDALGWSALALYSLRVDTSADSESFEAYPMLVVDIVDGEPRVVPAALKAASEALTDLDKETRSAVEDRLKILDERLALVSQIKEESRSASEGLVSEEKEDRESEAKPEAGPNAESSVGVNSERLDAAERIVERLAHQGRLLPAWGREALVGFISGLSDEKSLSDAGFEPISPLDFFTGLLESLPALVPLSEFASPQARVDNSFESLGRRIAQTLKPKVNVGG